MQRSPLLRWVASHWLRGLALAIGLLGTTQCLDSISDDCTKTLTCEDAQQPKLQPNCEWEYSDGSPWLSGPRYDRATSTWRWPDGKPTETQDFDCNVNLADAGADAGPDCRANVSCDPGQVCDPATGGCVQCVTNAECAGNMPMGDAGAASVCDPASRRCVECVDDDNCSGDASVCKIDAANSRRNACVECLVSDHCGEPNPICDERSNECTATCQSAGDCIGDKRACNTARNICVECTANDHCSTTPGRALCDVESNRCVECLDDGQCAGNASAKVCDVESHTCVECRADAQCQTVADPARPYCDTDAKQCVACLTDQQCTDVVSSRCNVVSHTCTGCTNSIQCESGVCNGLGSCVECVVSSDCTVPGVPFCESATARCVECLQPEHCDTAELAHCETSPEPEFDDTRYQCVGCKENNDCTGNGKTLPPLCDRDRGVCADCTGQGPSPDCLDSSTLSRCEDGECAVCSVDADCSLFAGPPSNAPACKPGVGCVACTESADCADTMATPICKIEEGSGTAAINTCVQCLSNADCRTNASAARCEDNECVPCEADADCSGVDSNGNANGGTPLNVCDAGTCVQCLARNRSACGANVCNSLTKACSTAPVGSAGLCDTCVSDAQCAASARCVQQTVGGTQQFFCYPLQSGNLCTTSGFAGQQSVATIDSPTAALCLQRETTCPAFVDYVSGQQCDDANDDEACGAGDGRCELGPQGFRCTIVCISAADCSGGSCLSGLCEL